ncbi:hypothetical protein J4210_04540 [Candidatus Woesearchaeota archaeon]|nr:hypothetical protein [Candidatus Woesearchaeota archaeon]
MASFKPRFKHLTIVLLLILITAISAAAAVQITDEKIIIEADYNQFTEESQKQIDVNGKVNLANDGTENAQISLEFSNLPTDYQAGEVTATLAAGETKTVPFTIKVPHKKGSGQSSIGTLTIKDALTKQVLASKTLTQNTKSMLLLSEIKVEYTDKTGKSRSQLFDTEKNAELTLDNNVKPGTEVKMTFELENLFDRDYDQDDAELSDLELEIEPDDLDLFVDQEFDEVYTFDDLGAQKKDSKVITFMIDDDVDPDEFVFEITLSAEDGKNFVHEVKKELTLSVERIRDDVRITTAEITPATAACEQSASIHLTIKNFGTNDQENVGLIIFNQKLGVKENIPDISLPRSSKSDNSYDFTTSFLIPKDLPAGAYPLDVTLLIRKNQDSDRQIIPFKLEKCTITEPASTENKAEENELAKTLDKTTGSATENAEKGQGLLAGKEPAAGDKAPSVKTSPVIKTIEDPYTNDDIAAALLITGVVIILAFITWMLVLLFQQGEQRTKEKEKESEGPHNEKRQKNQERVNSEKVVSSEKKSINKNKQTREEP